MIGSKSLSEFFRWVLLANYCILLYIAFTLPAEQIPRVVREADDKVLHFLDFLLLAIFAFRAFSYSKWPLFYLQADRKAAGFSFVYALFLEGVQRGIPSREMSFADVVADSLGIFLAWVVFRISRLTPSPQRVTLPPSKNP